MASCLGHDGGLGQLEDGIIVASAFQFDSVARCFVPTKVSLLPVEQTC